MGKKVYEASLSPAQGLDHCNTKLPSNLEDKIANFHMAVKAVGLEQDFTQEMIGNMDETPMFLMAAARTIATKGVIQILVRSTGAEK